MAPPLSTMAPETARSNGSPAITSPSSRSSRNGDSGSDKPSNEDVLNVAFFSFVGFLVIQAVFALIAKSQSMLADSEAMSVDAVTYLFNLCAERIKNRPPTEQELRLTPAQRQYKRELRRLYLEMIPPMASVFALICITCFTLKEAFGTLIFPDQEEEDDVSIPIMFIFSGANLLLDVVNVTCFARANVNFGLSIVKNEQHLIRESMRGVDFHAMTTSTETDDEDLEAEETTELLTTTRSLGVDDKEVRGTLVNLNMCSAWTHVCADTLRSTAVLVAASIALVFQSIDSAKADAVAAVIVSIIIFVSLIPLVQGLWLTAIEIQHLKRNQPSD